MKKLMIKRSCPKYKIFHTLLQLLFFFLIMMNQSCHVGRYFYYNYADINDHKKFTSKPVRTGEEPFSFYENLKPHKNLDLTLHGNEEESLNSFLSKNETVALLIVKSDTLVYEEYFMGYDRSSIVPVFSVVKSFVSALMGISISKGYIHSVQDTIGQYLPEIRGKGFESLTLENLLDMRSGIQFEEKYNSPFGGMAKFYYGTNLKKYIQQLKPEEKAGQKYSYQSVNTLLITQAIENASNASIAVLLEEEIWKPLGMQYDASWSVDSEKHLTIKSFCCLNTTAIDLARFGRLYLHQGNWNGKQIISKDWINSSLTIHNDSRDSQGYPYSHFWRVKEDGAFFAKGILGQYLYVDPNKDLIIVRLGKSSNDIDWPAFFETISKLI